MKLTAKQEKFCQSIADGMNQSDAYRAAYSAGGMKASSVTEKASELASNVNVTSRVVELKDALANKALWTREQSVAVLCGVVDDGSAKHGDKISAVKVLNDMQGFNAPAKLHVTGSININVGFDG